MSSETDKETKTQTNSLTALVEFQVRTDSTTVPQWLDVWAPRGQDALVGEPETTAYEALISAEDETKILVFERYANGQASLQAHVERPAHATLMQTMGEAQMTKRRVFSNLFADVADYGWWGRPERTDTMRDKEILVTVIGTRFDSQQMLDKYLQLTGDHARYCQTAEPDTLVYSGGIAQRDGDRGPDIAAGDLMFIAAFTDAQAAAKHRDDPNHLALLPQLEEINRKRTYTLSYRTTGKGFLWS